VGYTLNRYTLLTSHPSPTLLIFWILKIIFILKIVKFVVVNVNLNPHFNKYYFAHKFVPSLRYYLKNIVGVRKKNSRGNLHLCAHPPSNSNTVKYSIIIIIIRKCYLLYTEIVQLNKGGRVSTTLLYIRCA